MSELILGAAGMVGSALARRLPNAIKVTRADCDLLDLKATMDMFQNIKPSRVYMAAAKVGGINANNSYPVEFINQNLQIQLNVMQAAHEIGVERLLFLGSSCIYPREAKQPIQPSSLMTGPLEPTNSAYAVAKIAGIEMVKSYRKQYGHKWITAMPTNLYGPGDNYDLENSHVVAALIRKICEAFDKDFETVEIWGSGKPLREFMHVFDLANALVFLMNNYDNDEPINVGSGIECSIKELAQIIADAAGYTGKFIFNEQMPDGTPRKIMDSSVINNLGWHCGISLQKGIAKTVELYQNG